MSSELTYDDLKENMVIRIKDFEREDMPQHWVNSMLDFSNLRFRVREKFQNSSNSPHYRVRLKQLHTDTPLNGFFFAPEDFQKANTKDD